MSKKSIDCLPILRIAQNEKLGLLGVTLEPGPQTGADARLNFLSDNKHAAVAFAAGERQFSKRRAQLYAIEIRKPDIIALGYDLMASAVPSDGNQVARGHSIRLPIQP